MQFSLLKSILWCVVLLISSLFMAVLSYVISSVILFGSALQPITLLVHNELLSMPYWSIPTLSVLVSLALVIRACMKTVSWIYALPLFVCLSMSLSVFNTVVIVDRAKAAAISKLRADKVVSISLWESLRNAPQDVQLFLHVKALKNCQPYGWSYRTMDFYKIPPNAAVNVLPRDWVSECQIDKFDIGREAPLPSRRLGQAISRETFRKWMIRILVRPEGNLTHVRKQQI